MALTVAQNPAAAPGASIDEISTLLDTALTTVWEAEAAAVELAIRLMCMRARDAAPTAAAVRLEWSDQGDFLTVLGVEDADGIELDDAWHDEECLAWNFGGHTEARWLAFMVHDGPDRDTTRGTFRLPIDKTLEHFASGGVLNATGPGEPQ
jgi:hypothetical protein